jgi:hypothetical protein
MIAVELVGGRTAVKQQIKREVKNRSPAQVSPARRLVVQNVEVKQAGL